MLYHSYLIIWHTVNSGLLDEYWSDNELVAMMQKWLEHWYIQRLSWCFLFPYNYVTSDLIGSIHFILNVTSEKPSVDHYTSFNKLNGTEIFFLLTLLCLLYYFLSASSDTLMQLRPFCKLHDLTCKCGHFQCPVLYRNLSFGERQHSHWLSPQTTARFSLSLLHKGPRAKPLASPMPRSV